MSAMSDYLENAIINFFLRGNPGGSITAGTGYLALFLNSDNVADDGSGTELTVGDGYAREEVTFDEPSGGSASNSADVEFTADGDDWGEIGSVGLFDASTSGNLLYHGTITPATINDGDTLRFSAGNITVANQ